MQEVDLGTDPTVHFSFLQEATLLWRLRHRNVVSLTGVSIAPDGTGYLLMVGKKIPLGAGRVDLPALLAFSASLLLPLPFPPLLAPPRLSAA